MTEHSRGAKTGPFLQYAGLLSDCDSGVSHQPGHLFLGSALQSETSPTQSSVLPSLLHDLKTAPPSACFPNQSIS